jgi:tetratricopeptide (TPR) repeat protein
LNDYENGRTLYKNTSFDKALTYFKKAHEEDSDNLNYSTALGKTYFNLGKFKESLSYYNKILDFNPMHVKSLIGKYASLANLNETSEAMKLLDENLMNFNHGYLWAIKGELLSFNHARNSDIKECFKNAHELCGDTSYLYYLQAKSFVHDLDYEKASISFNKSIEGIDDSACDLDEDIFIMKLMVMLQKGWMYHSIDEYDEALECFEEILKINRKCVEALYAKSLIYFELGEYIDSKDVLNLLLTLEPENLNALNLKASIFGNEGSNKTALRIYKQILEIDENQLYPQRNIAAIQYKEKQYDDSLKSSMKALSIDPNNSDTLYVGLLAAKKLGKKGLIRELNNKLSDSKVNSIILEKNLQDKLINEYWRLRKLGYNLKFLKRELTLTDRPGRLDLLYRDRDTNELVVVELKVVPATKKTYEQIINYMDSINKTRASGKNVKGIVISLGYDETFKSLIDDDPNVSQINYKKLGL